VKAILAWQACALWSYTVIAVVNINEIAKHNSHYNIHSYSHKLLSLVPTLARTAGVAFNTARLLLLLSTPAGMQS
jgi:hypothetical protein